MKILLMGNPNVGKSVVFNRLTGANVIASNYAGTTVEFTKGRIKLGDKQAELIDVPGTYTLEPTCRAEEIAVEMLNKHSDGDVIINRIHKDLNDDSGKYFASNLRGIHKLENGKYMINPDKKFNIIEQGVTSSLDNIFIATDGFLDKDIREHIIFEKFFLNFKIIFNKSYILIH